MFQKRIVGKQVAGANGQRRHGDEPQAAAGAGETGGAGEPEIAEMAWGEEDEEEPVSALSVEFLVTIPCSILIQAQPSRHD